MFFLRACFLASLLLIFLDEEANCQLFSNKGNNSNREFTSAEFNNKDTADKKQQKTNDSIAIYYFTYQDTTHTKLDSSITLLHRSPILNEWETDLGNFGSAANSFYFNPSLQPNNKLGIISNASYLYDLNEVKFYNTTRPYSNLYYRIGTKQEQIIEITHSRNINPLWNMTASYRKAGSPGAYKLQRTNNDNLFVSSNYISLNKQYEMKVALLYNKTQQDENGGIENEELLFFSNYNNKRLMPVVFDDKSGETNRSNMTNSFRDISLNLKHQYFFGAKDSLLSTDSSEKIYSFKPIFGIKHILYTTGSLNSFKDHTPDSGYYTILGNYSFRDNDSLYTKHRLRRIGNAVSLTGNVIFKENVMQAEAGYGVEFDYVMNYFFAEEYINNYLFANIHKDAKKQNEWLYEAYLKLYFTGNLIGNVLLSAQAGRNFNEQFGKVRIGFDQVIQNAPLNYEVYQSNYYSFKTSANKQTISKVNVTYDNDTYHFSAKLNYYLMANYLYRDTTLMTKQYSKLIPLTQLDIFKRLKWRRFVFDNTVLLQFISDKAPIHLPLFASVSRLAYESAVLKKKLNMSTGFECRYNTSFYTDHYSPLLHSFVTQYNRKIDNAPRLSYFFNFKVKTFRGTVSVDQIQQLFTRNNLNYANYPGQNFMARFGFHWMFVN